MSDTGYIEVQLAFAYLNADGVALYELLSEHWLRLGDGWIFNANLE